MFRDSLNAVQWYYLKVIFSQKEKYVKCRDLGGITQVFKDTFLNVAEFTKRIEKQFRNSSKVSSLSLGP